MRIRATASTKGNSSCLPISSPWARVVFGQLVFALHDANQREQQRGFAVEALRALDVGAGFLMLFEQFLGLDQAPGAQ